MPTSSINVLVTMPFPAYLLERLEAVSPRLNVMQREARTAADYADLVEDIQVLYTFKALPLPEEAPALRWVEGRSGPLDTPSKRSSPTRYTGSYPPGLFSLRQSWVY